MTVKLNAAIGRSGPKTQIRRRSRKGCRNCKIRGIKCDEQAPRCSQCTNYGVVCNYGSSKSDLELSVQGAFHVLELPVQPTQWHSESEQMLCKFQNRTAYTISVGPRLYLFQTEVVELAKSNQYLLDSITALTIMHDRYLSNTFDTRLSVRELSHWNEATSSFQKRLSEPLRRGENAALWTTAALLGTIVFLQTDARNMHEAWPLKEPSSTDLDWLRFSDGKKDVWKAVRPSEPDPTFRALTAVHIDELWPKPTTEPNVSVLPPGFLELYDMHIQTGNPYSAAVTSLIRVLEADCQLVQTVIAFLSFISTMDPELKERLFAKEPRALLLLAWWYATICRLPIWWLLRRAWLEGQAICHYLEERYSDDSDFVRLIQFPKIALMNTKIVHPY